MLWAQIVVNKGWEVLRDVIMSKTPALLYSQSAGRPLSWYCFCFVSISIWLIVFIFVLLVNCYIFRCFPRSASVFVPGINSGYCSCFGFLVLSVVLFQMCILVVVLGSCLSFCLCFPMLVRFLFWFWFWIRQLLELCERVHAFFGRKEVNLWESKGDHQKAQMNSCFLSCFL